MCPKIMLRYSITECPASYSSGLHTYYRVIIFILYSIRSLQLPPGDIAFSLLATLIPVARLGKRQSTGTYLYSIP